LLHRVNLNALRSILRSLFVVAVSAVACHGAALAQQVFQPTVEQMQMLNQLPPAQRQQAMDALRQFQEQQRQRQAEGQAGTLGEVDPGVQQRMRDLYAVPLPAKEEVPRAEPRTSLVITVTPKFSLTPEEVAEIEEDPALSRVEGSHYYELDDSGALQLPGLSDIPLLGLTVGGIEQRLTAEPALAMFDIRATLLDAEEVGVAALEPFGYDLFEPPEPGTIPTVGGMGTAAASQLDSQLPMAGPVPADYVLGPGDSVRVQLFGNVNNIYELGVSRDGTLNIPELGPVNVAGMRYSDFRVELEQRVQEMLIGTQLSVTMGALRTIRVFVVGDVNKPGSYVVSSLATISSALYRSGGISDVGTLRDVQLRRSGETVVRLDLYDLLLRGDTSDDQQLQQGDAIFVPPIGTTIGVGGAVKRPAIYEVKGDVTVAEALNIAGGLAADAYPEGSTLERIGSNKVRSVLSVDMSNDRGRSLQVRDGDILMVPRILPELDDTVVLQGHVHRPGPYEWHEGMRITDLIPSLNALKPGADANYLLIRRHRESGLSIDTLSADVAAALAAPQSEADLQLHSRDTVYVFNLEFGRQRVIQPVLEELKLQAGHGNLYEEVRIAGRVRAPGSYPLDQGMRLSDLLRAGGNLSEGAYTQEAELTRLTVVNGEHRNKRVVQVDLEAVLRGDPEADLLLAPYDHLNISPIPDWDSDWSVTVEGEVRFPGEYQILRGETLSQLMERVGGLTNEAFPEGAIFLREDLKEREREQIEVLANRLESDLVSMSLEAIDTVGSNAMTIGQSLLTQLRATEPVGRLVIDLNRLFGGTVTERHATDLELQDGDRLLIPGRSQSVTVLGETQYPASHLYDPEFGRDDYIARSGGLTRRADEGLIYIVRASGSVVSNSRSSWFRGAGATEIRPGDTIVVPLETDRIRPLTFWTNVTQIFYQTAIAIAAIRAFEN
jgi:protein involved in polysaccharide export with SLBB domain